MATVNKNLLKAIRNGTGKTQKQVAEEVGIHIGVYARYENGQREPSVSVAKRIAEAILEGVGYCSRETSYSPDRSIDSSVISKSLRRN